jgi:NTP pyrophosphatase (non-canonical NTP hydrolase)
MSNISFQEAIDLARQVIHRFEKIEGKPWGVEGAMMELSKQVGELAKMVMGYERYYFPNRDQLNPQYAVSREKIGDELADILYAIIRIADHYQIDLIDSHTRACAEALESIDSLSAKV